MTNHEHKWKCDFGSGSVFGAGLNSAHIVLAIDDGGDVKKRANIAFKPKTLHEIATRLLLLAEVYDPSLRDERSMFIEQEWDADSIAKFRAE